MKEIPQMQDKNKIINLTNKHKKRIVMFILVCVLIYIIYIVMNLIKNPTDTVYVETGQIQEEETAEGYIIRDETVIKGNNYKNGIEQIKTEGEKVAKGEEIFRYYSNDEKELVEKIKKLDAKIDETMSEEKLSLIPDTKILEEQIDSTINKLYGESNLEVIKNSKQEINTNITKKAKIAGDKSPAGSYLKKLIDERKKYENQLNSGTEYLKSTKSGIVSYRVDGYEEVFVPNDFGKYDKEFLESLNLKTGQIIPTSNESGKIIDNYYCYIVSILKSSYAKESKVGDKVKLRLPNEKEINAIIEYKTMLENECIITFKIDKEVENLTSYRKISFNIIWWNESGLKVPNNAINKEIKEGKEITYINRTRIGYEDKILVKVLKSNEKYSIVTNYTSEELLQMGYTSEQIWSLPTITIYDEILIN